MFGIPPKVKVKSLLDPRLAKSSAAVEDAAHRVIDAVKRKDDAR